MDTPVIFNEDWVAIDRYARHAGPHPPSLINITRVDYRGTHGWNVRFKRGEVWLRTLFSDSTWGDPEEALRRAIEYRNRALKGLPLPDKSNTETNTGTPFLSFTRIRRRGKMYEVVKHTRRPFFSVLILPNKRTKREALQQAELRSSCIHHTNTL